MSARHLRRHGSEESSRADNKESPLNKRVYEIVSQEDQEQPIHKGMGDSLDVINDAGFHRADLETECSPVGHPEKWDGAMWIL